MEVFDSRRLSNELLGEEKLSTETSASPLASSPRERGETLAKRSQGFGQSLQRKGEPCVLVVDDEIEVARSHVDLIKGLGFTAHYEIDPTRALARISQHPDINLVLLDVRMPELNGLELLAMLRSQRPDIGVIMATVVNDIEHAVRATKAGAYNYLLKPLQSESLGRAFDSCVKNRPTPCLDDPMFRQFITGEQSFLDVFHKIRVFAEADVPILINGETGTGKEILARASHALSPRSKGPFIAVNIASLSKELFEAELFGHARGAYTGAHSSRAGYFEQAEGGTLFIDEIGELPLEQQKKLLRVLQTGDFQRVGETTPRRLNARLVFATNRDLKSESANDTFRADLFFRFASHNVELPPLRERKGDIALLANYFLQKYTSQYGRQVASISAEALVLIETYDFPGNVRELEGIFSAAVLIEQSGEILAASLPQHLQQQDSDADPATLDSVKRSAILKALAESDGNQGLAAKKLGIARGTLNRLLKQYKLQGR